MLALVIQSKALELQVVFLRPLPHDRRANFPNIIRFITAIYSHSTANDIEAPLLEGYFKDHNLI